MGVMFDIKILGYTQVLNSRTDLSITKDKDKEQRKRRQKEKRINPPAMVTASNPSSPSSSPQPPYVTSPGRIFGSSNPGGPMSPSASLTPFSGSPGTLA